MSSVIVTGSNGFIGGALVKLLRQRGDSVTGLNRSHGDVQSRGTWASLPPADHVVHLAGRVYVPDSWKAPADFYSSNVVGAARAIEYCREHNAHLVYVSGYVYGIPQRLPIDESHPLNPNNPYALSKELGERVCRFHAENESLSVTIVRPFNVYGPGQDDTFLVPSIVKQVLRGAEIRVMDLLPRRDYLFVQDLVDGICRTLAEPGGLRCFNFGSGRSHSVADVIALAQNAAGTELPVVCENARRSSEIDDVVADIGNAQRALGWQPRVNLGEGLRLTLGTELCI